MLLWGFWGVCSSLHVPTGLICGKWIKPSPRRGTGVAVVRPSGCSNTLTSTNTSRRGCSYDVVKWGSLLLTTDGIVVIIEPRRTLLNSRVWQKALENSTLPSKSMRCQNRQKERVCKLERMGLHSCLFNLSWSSPCQQGHMCPAVYRRRVERWKNKKGKGVEPEHIAPWVDASGTTCISSPFLYSLCCERQMPLFTHLR